MSSLIEQIIRHEGLRLFPYKDSVGKLTIGVGRNLDDVGISEEEALMLLKRDIATARDELLKSFPAFTGMTEPRLDVLINMVFNIGISRFKGFKKMTAALVVHDYREASKEMLDSRWARQVGIRADELAHQMRTNAYKWE